MRIRQRQPLFPLPSLSPLPLSDPHFLPPSPVVVQLHHPPHPPPSDHPLPPIATPPHDSSAQDALHAHSNKRYGSEEDGRGRGEGGDKGDDARKGSILGSETAAEVVLSPSSPSNQDGRWCEGEKAIPLKKRRGSFERVKAKEEEDGVAQNINTKKAKTRMKTKMNKKFSRQSDNELQDRGDEDEDEDDVVVVGERERETKRERNAGKKRGRGSAVMEGSRCSRVNGRGWRCCQQTLVGYSLCEHHLGKGRLRSITSVKSRSVATNNAPPPMKLQSPPLSQVSTSSSPEKQTNDEDDEDKDEKKPVIITKKRMKLGVVKARSMSSLLGQTNTHVAVAPESSNNKVLDWGGTVCFAAECNIHTHSIILSNGFNSFPVDWIATASYCPPHVVSAFALYLPLQ